MDYVSKPTRINYGLQKKPEAHGDRLTYILGRLSHLQADIHEKKMHGSEICDQAVSILKDLWDWDADWQQSLRLCGTISELSLPEGYDFFLSHTMNYYRAARLSINQILSAHSSSVLCPDLEGLCCDIYATIPYSGSNENVLLLLWPLVMTATTTTNVDLRARVKDSLRAMGEKMGIGQSLVLLESLGGTRDVCGRQAAAMDRRTG